MIPHQWYYKGAPCEIEPVVDRIRMVVCALMVKTAVETVRVDSDDDGEFPGVEYELIQ